MRSSGSPHRPPRTAARSDTAPDAATARQLVAAGAFVEANLDFFLAFANPATPNSFNPPFDGTAMGAAAENRPVIGSWKLGPDDALIIEVTPPIGLYWSLSIGNVWWETIDYAEHIIEPQRSPSGGRRRRCPPRGHRAPDPGVANWIDTAGHTEGPMILRCVRTESAPVPTTSVVRFDELDAVLPPGTERVTPERHAPPSQIDARAVARRFVR